MNARDRFIDVLRSRGMLRPGEEWVIDANLDAFAHELAEQQRGLMVYELDWAPGNHQWQCPRCDAVGNVTPRMASTPGPWHQCRATAPSAGPAHPDEETTT